jgi:hypothetical protein
VDAVGGGVVYVMQSVRPFWVSGTIEEALGLPLAYRSHGGQWTKCSEKNNQETYLTSPSVPRSVARDASRMLDRGDPRRLAKAAETWRQKSGVPMDDGDCQLAERLADVVDAVDPQTVIESLLSREWGNWDPNSRWQRGLSDLSGLIAKRLDGEVRFRIANESEKIFRELVENKRASAPWLGQEELLKSATAGFDFRRLQEEFDTAWERLDIAMQPPGGVERRKDDAPHPVDKRREEPGRADLIEAWGMFLTIASKIISRDTSATGVMTDWAEESRSRLARLLKLNQGMAFFAATGFKLAFYDHPADKSHGFPEDPPPPVFPRVANGGDGVGVDLTEMREAAWAQRKELREIAALARERCQVLMDAALVSVAKGWQKPDHVVSRSSVGPDRDRILPLAHSWDDEWYVGPPAPVPDRPDDA